NVEAGERKEIGTGAAEIVQRALDARREAAIRHALPEAERRDPMLERSLARLPAAPERFAPAGETVARADAHQQAIQRAARNAAEGRLWRPVVVGNAQRDGLDARDRDFLPHLSQFRRAALRCCRKRRTAGSRSSPIARSYASIACAVSPIRASST